MESTKRFLLFIFVAGFVTSNVFCALRSKMTGVISVSDASDVTWAHAVNSKGALEKALAGPVDFLEADVSLGHVEGHGQSSSVPIMAHPPDTTSDISLDTWLNTVTTMKPEKSIKLDFKSIDVLEPSLIILQKYSSKFNSSVWLNADVLSGPINSTTIPVMVDKFLTITHQYFPAATLSIGWTTYWYPTFDPDHWHYGWKHVREMADVIQCRGYEGNHPNFTFPVRGIFASRSIRQLQWLVAMIPNSTLTVWTGKYDPLKVEDLLRIRASFPKDRVYYDVPEEVNEVFQEEKNNADVPAQVLIPDDGQWMTFARGQSKGCSTMTYARNGIIVFGKSLNTTVLRENAISLSEGDNLKVSGKIKFFDTMVDSYALTARSSEERHSLTLVLADVSLFAKDSPLNSQDNVDLSVSDTDVIWSAMNSSDIYTFRHAYGMEHTSCRRFELDTSRDRSFEVWTVPCGAEDANSRAGIPEISSRKRLVLPRGPFMIGFVSSGEEHVAVYDLKVEIQRVGGGEALKSGSKLSAHTNIGLLSVIIAFVCALCNFF